MLLFVSLSKMGMQIAGMMLCVELMYSGSHIAFLLYDFSVSNNGLQKLIVLSFSDGELIMILS